MGDYSITSLRLQSPVPGMPGSWWVVDGDELPMPLLLRIGRTPSGEVACTGLLMGHEGEHEDGDVRAITTRALRLPLADIVSEIAAGLRSDYRAAHKGDMVSIEGDDIRQVLGYFVDRSPTAVPRSRPGRTGHPERWYTEVAERYRKAVAEHPRAPTKALAEQYEAPEATVRYWLRIARERGLLGKSEPGRAGEIEQPRRKGSR